MHVVILGGIPSQKEANQNHYRPGCIHATKGPDGEYIRKPEIPFNDKLFLQHGVNTYRECGLDVDIIGPEDVLRPILGDSVTYHDQHGSQAEKLLMLPDLEKKLGGPFFLATNDILPTEEHVLGMMALQQQYPDAAGIVPMVETGYLIEKGFRDLPWQKSYAVWDEDGDSRFVAFPNMWFVHPSKLRFDIVAESGAADYWYRTREAGVNILTVGWATAKMIGTYMKNDEDLSPRRLPLSKHLAPALSAMGVQKLLPWMGLPFCSYKRAEKTLAQIMVEPDSEKMVVKTTPFWTLAADIDTWDELDKAEQLIQSGEWK